MVEEIKKKTDTFLQGLREDFDKAVIELITEKETLTNGDYIFISINHLKNIKTKYILLKKSKSLKIVK